MSFPRASSSAAALREAMCRRQPSAAKPAAQAYPMPFDAPVTSTVLPRSSRSMASFFLVGCCVQPRSVRAYAGGLDEFCDARDVLADDPVELGRCARDRVAAARKNRLPRFRQLEDGRDLLVQAREGRLGGFCGGKETEPDARLVDGEAR